MSLKRLRDILISSDYDQLEVFTPLLESRAQAILLYMRARQSKLANIINENDLHKHRHNISLLEKAYDLRVAWPPISNTLADSYAILGDYLRHTLQDFAGAITEYERALTQQSDNLIAIFGRGIARLNLGNYSDALTDFDHYLKIQKAHANPFYFRGLTKYNLGDLAGALADYDRALELRPEDPRTLTRRGLARADLGDTSGALDDHDRALALRPEEPMLLHNRGFAKSKLGDYVGAVADYDQALALQPDEPYVLNKRGFAKRKLGDLDGAIHDFERSLEIRPDHARPVINIATVHALCGQSDLAIDWLARAVNMDPKWREFVRTEPDFDSIRADPRFIALVGEETRTRNGGTADTTEC